MMEIPQWGARSQRCVAEEKRLKLDLERCQALILHFSKHVADYELQVEYQTQLAITGDGMADLTLPQRLQDMQGFKLQLEAYKTKEASLQAKISDLANPSPAQVEATKNQQTRIVDLVS